MALVLNKLGKPLRHIIRNRKTGEPVILNKREQKTADYQEDYIKNVLGFDVPITTMTTIAREITEQVFYEIDPTLYVPTVEGQGAWSDQILTYRSYQIGDSFETGISNMAQNNARIENVDAGIDSVKIPVYLWDKTITWSIPQMEMAAKAGNWDLIGTLEESRKTNFDLGIQRIAFLGGQGFQTIQSNMYGLLNLPNVNVDTSVFTAAGNVEISAMSVTQLNTFVANLVNVYRINSTRTAWPTHFYVPEDDYIGMGGTQYSPTFPIGTTLEILEKAFKKQIPNGGFKGILPIAYAIPANSFGALSVHTYMLVNHNVKTFNMQLPVPYTTTVPNSLNNFQLQDVGYAQFTGVQAIKPRELCYFTGTF